MSGARVLCFTALSLRMSVERWHAYAVEVFLEESRADFFREYSSMGPFPIA